MAAASAAATPLFSFGLIADIQYSDIADGKSFDGTETRRYRLSLQHAKAAASFFAATGCSTVVQIGDLIDGVNNPGAPVSGGVQGPACPASLAALNAALQALSSEAYGLYHVRGNHEIYNFSLAEQKALLPLPAREPPTAFPDPDLFYYAFSPHPQWSFLVLDAYDVSLSRPPGSEENLEARRLLKANNPNPCAWGEEGPKGNFFTGIRDTLQARFVPFNGGVGKRQLQWLAEQLGQARARGQRVAVFSHVPFSPSSVAPTHEAGDIFSTLLWNYEELNAVLEPFAGSTVAAVFCGHNHGGSFGMCAGIPHFTLPSPLIWEQGSHAVVHVFEDKLELETAGAAQVALVEICCAPKVLPLAPVQPATTENKE